MAVMIALLVCAVYFFQYVKSEYFPYASRNQIMIDFWFDEGTPIVDREPDSPSAKAFEKLAGRVHETLENAEDDAR